MWQERAWSRRDDREMTFSVRKSSAGRWNGFEAILYDASAGFSEQQFVRHNVSMQIGKPLLVTSRCDGETLRRLQVPGDVKIVPPGVPRIWETQSATTKLSMYLSSTLIEHLGWAVNAELETPEPLGRLYGESLGLALAAHVLRAYGPTRPIATDARLPQRRLTRVLDFVRTNIASDLSMSELAAVAGVSPSHFKTLFKQSVGMPVHQYVIRRRVEYAVELLQNDRSVLADVALQAGFANQSHLARCMRATLGITPGTLRRTLS
jgi:AraC family transcriptional regulator